MQSVLRSSLPVLAIGFLTMLIVWAAQLETSLSVFPVLIVLATAILGLIAGVRKWQKAPFGAMLGVAMASVGYALDSNPLMTGGFFAFTVMTVWQEHQLEPRLRTTSA